MGESGQSWCCNERRRLMRHDSGTGFVMAASDVSGVKEDCRRMVRGGTRPRLGVVDGIDAGGFATAPSMGAAAFRQASKLRRSRRPLPSASCHRMDGLKRRGSPRYLQ